MTPYRKHKADDYRRLAEQGLTAPEAARLMGRTVGGVKAAAKYAGFAFPKGRPGRPRKCGDGMRPRHRANKGERHDDV